MRPGLRVFEFVPLLDFVVGSESRSAEDFGAARSLDDVCCRGTAFSFFARRRVSGSGEDVFLGRSSKPACRTDELGVRRLATGALTRFDRAL